MLIMPYPSNQCSDPSAKPLNRMLITVNMLVLSTVIKITAALNRHPCAIPAREHSSRLRVINDYLIYRLILYTPQCGANKLYVMPHHLQVCGRRP